MLAYLWVALGGALGSVGRYWLATFVAGRLGDAFPWGTIFINVTGSFVIGLIAGVADTRGVSSGVRLFVMAGICGGYTTFSAFSLQTLNLLRDRQWLGAGGNVLLSVGLCLAAVGLGYALGAAFSPVKGR